MIVKVTETQCLGPYALHSIRKTFCIRHSAKHTGAFNSYALTLFDANGSTPMLAHI